MTSDTPGLRPPTSVADLDPGPLVAWATAALADRGAEVVGVEPPTAGTDP